MLNIDDAEKNGTRRCYTRLTDQRLLKHNADGTLNRGLVFGVIHHARKQTETNARGNRFFSTHVCISLIPLNLK